MIQDARHDVPGRNWRAGTAGVAAFSAVVLAVGLLAMPARAAGAREPARNDGSRVQQLVAPVALYPDSLLAQVLMASTFPDQVGEADRWMHANPRVPLPELDDALATSSWDPSVISLCMFPPLLARMAASPGWTADLGRAFASSPHRVLEAVQTLRRDAYRTGALRSNAEQTVTATPAGIEVRPLDPKVVRLPLCDPTAVYGAGWEYDPAAYPSAWLPPAGSQDRYGVAWGRGWYAAGVLFGGVDWATGTVSVDKAVIAGSAVFRGTDFYRHRGSYAEGSHAWVRAAPLSRTGAPGALAPYGGRDHGFIHGIQAPPVESVAKRDPTVVPLPDLQWHDYRPDAVFIPPVEPDETPVQDSYDEDAAFMGDTGWGYSGYGPSCGDEGTLIPRTGRGGECRSRGGPGRRREPPPPSPPPPPPHPRPGPEPRHEGTGHVEKDGGPQRRGGGGDAPSRTDDRRTPQAEDRGGTRL